MRRFAEIYRPIVVGGLILAVLIALFAGFQYYRAVQTDAKAQKVRDQTTILQELLAASANAQVGKIAAVPIDPAEETNFIAFLKSSAKATGVVIARYTYVPQAPPPPSGAGTGNPAENPNPTPDLLAGITPLVGETEVYGSFGSLLRFTDLLLAGNRLYNLTNVGLARDSVPGRVRLSMTITRYVETSPAAAPAPTKVASQ